MNPSCHPLVAPGSFSLDLPLLFLTGLTISLGHCLGMCGPIQGAFVAAQETQPDGWRRRVFPLLRYHLGRILSYGVIGAILAVIGSATRVFDSAAVLQGGLAVATGVLMIPVGFGVIGWMATPKWIEPSGITRGITDRIRVLLTARTGMRQFGLGIANGFLPCGPVAAMALSAAAAAQVWVGALLMVIYGAGTLPVLLTIGAVSTQIGPRFRSRFHRVGGVLVLMVAIQLCLRGLSTLGYLPHVRLGAVVFW